MNKPILKLESKPSLQATHWLDLSIETKSVFGVVRGAIACGYDASCRVRSNGVVAYSDDRDLVTCKECYRIILASGGTVRGVKQP